MNKKELNRKIKECDEIENHVLRDSCYCDVAVNTNDVSICPKIGGPAAYNGLKNRCYKGIAVNK